jgi:uncharacterized protein YcbK (DUF882 family)
MAMAATVFASPFSAWAHATKARERSLAFLNLHTGERLRAVYWADGYVDDELARIDSVLRDHRTGDVRPMDRRLLDLLHRLSARLDTTSPFHVISGYRSPKTNAKLAGKNKGVAKRSLHVKGMAIDIRLPDRKIADLRKVAISLKGGGVGYYPRSDFVHVDVGRVRSW